MAAKVAAGGRVDAAEALLLYRRGADAAARPAGRRHPPAQAPVAGRHLHHRPQRQLHEHLRGALQLLRVLPRGRLDGRLRAGLRGDLPQDRRDHRRRRQPAAAAGRPQPRPAAGRGTRTCSAPIKAQYPDFKLHALSPPEVLHISRLERHADRGRHRPADRGRPRQHSRRRRRDAGGPRPQDPELLHEGVVRRVAGHHARGAPGGPAHHRHDDVRHGRDRRGADRAHDAAARPAGRDRRVHGLHHLELSARAHRARRLRADRRGLPADAGAGAHRARQLRQPAGVVGDPGRQGGAAQPGLRRQRHGQRDDRGERRPRGGRRLLHGRSGDRDQRRGRRLHRRCGATCTTRCWASRCSATRTCRACCRWPPRASTATRRCPRS